MAWKRRRSVRPASPGAAPTLCIAPDMLSFPPSTSAEIAVVAMATGEDPLELEREVRAFRQALSQDRPLSTAVDAIAISTLGPDQVGARAYHPRRHRLTAAAGLLVIALVSGSAVVAVAATNHRSNGSHVAAFELSAAQQYGVLAVAVNERSPGQIVAAAAALHESLAPLIAAAPTDDRAAKTAMLLLTNERALLLSSGAQTPMITGAIAQSQSLITQLQNTTNTPVPPVMTLPTIVFPTSSPEPTTGPTTPPSPEPTSTPSPQPSDTPNPSPLPTDPPNPAPTVPALFPQATAESP